MDNIFETPTFPEKGTFPVTIVKAVKYDDERHGPKLSLTLRHENGAVGYFNICPQSYSTKYAKAGQRQMAYILSMVPDAVKTSDLIGKVIRVKANYKQIRDWYGPLFDTPPKRELKPKEEPKGEWIPGYGWYVEPKKKRRSKKAEREEIARLIAEAKGLV